MERTRGGADKMKKLPEIERLEKYDVFEDKEDKITMDELSYYCFNCSGDRFAQDIFDLDFLSSSGDDDYVVGKFRQFRDEFQEFLYSLDSGNRKKLTTAIKKFYK